MNSGKSRQPVRSGQTPQNISCRLKPFGRKGVIRLAILLIALPVFLFCSYQLAFKLYSDARDERRMQEVVSLKPIQESNYFEAITTSEPTEMQYSMSGETLDNPDEVSRDLPYQVMIGKHSDLNDAGILKDYEALWQRNDDLIGWIQFPGFAAKSIDYPILYSGDNSFYLRRDFDGKDSVAGSIFLEESNKPYDFTNPVLDRNYVLYGHAMRNLSMFGQLTDYWSNEKSWANKIIYIDFLNTRLEYQVFSTFVCEPDFNYRQTVFSSDEQYLDYLNTLLEKSAHDFGLPVNKDDRILTLSTCYQKTSRTAIVAKLVRQIVYPQPANPLPDEIAPQSSKIMIVKYR